MDYILTIFKKMLGHPKKADRNLKRIFICNDIYLDVLRLLLRVKVGLELALVSDRFDALVDTHFKSRKWTLCKLHIYSEDIDKTNDHGSVKELLFPLIPLPNSIVGFSFVRICEIDSNAIIFLKCIGRLLESNVCLHLFTGGESTWNTFATFVWPLLNVSAIIKIHFESSIDLLNFRRHISPSLLSDCSNLRMISFSLGNLQFPPDDSKGSSQGQALCKWLHTPRADGQPKVLKSWWNGDEVTMEALKKSFLNATTSVSFFIRLYSFISVGPFELANSLTREQLTCQRINDHFIGQLWLIERSPTDKSAEQWAEWEKEALEDEENDRKVLGILLSKK